jgi:hypothetical protein
MNINLRVSDELFESYVALDAKNPRKVMEKVLEKFQGFDPDRPYVVLGTKELAALSEGLGFPVSTFEDLKAWLQKAARVNLQDVGEIPLNQGQRQRLKDMAKYMGLPYETYVRDMVTKAVTTIVGP